MKQKVVAIVGPTCTGKTALSIRIGKRIPAEIIGCDSRNVYKYFDIGSAKPSLSERQSVPHHLIDVAEPDIDFTASDFAQAGAIAIDDICSREKLPIVCGGTGFYARALLEGLDIPNIPPQKELRESLRQEEEENPGSLYRKLCQLDPARAQNVYQQDIFRIVRALEISIFTGKTNAELTQTREAPYDVLWIGLSLRDRDKLKILIKSRVDELMSAGMLDEVKDLLQRFGRSQKIMSTVNYRDLCKYIADELSLEQALEEACRHTYQLARKQMMWFKTNKKISWFYVDETPRENIEQEVMQMIEQFICP